MLNQKWLMIGNEIVSRGVQSRVDQSKCLDVLLGNKDDGAKVGLYSRHGGLNQLWNITAKAKGRCDPTHGSVTNSCCTPSNPCQLDEGDCDSDADCGHTGYCIRDAASGLQRCLQRCDDGLDCRDQFLCSSTQNVDNRSVDVCVRE